MLFKVAVTTAPTCLCILTLAYILITSRYSVGGPKEDVLFV